MVNGEYLFVKPLSQLVAQYQLCKVPYTNVAVKFEPENVKDANSYMEIVWLKRYGNERSGLTRVPRFHSYGEFEGRKFLIMQHIDLSIDQYVAMKSDNDPQKRLELIEALSAQMLQSVYELHVSGFVHGNVNPKNFRVDSKDGKVYIIDF